MTSAEYAAVKVPRSMTDSLGKQAAVLHSAVLVFLKTDVESGGGYASSLWPGLLEAAYPELQCSLDWRMVAVLMQCLRNRGVAPDTLNAHSPVLGEGVAGLWPRQVFWAMARQSHACWSQALAARARHDCPRCPDMVGN